MKMTAVFVMTVLLASCGGDKAPRAIVESRAAAGSKTAPLTPPPPPLPGSSFEPIPEARALEAARRRGPGGCGDLQNIRALPMKREFGLDPYYDRIMVHIDSYEQCLLEATSDTSRTRVEVSSPGDSIETLGDLAFALLVDAEKVQWGECTPEDVMKKERREGASAFYAWLKQPGMRKRWHDCLVRRHGR